MRWYPGSRADPALSFSGLSRASCIDTRFRMCLRREGAAHAGARVSSASRRERRSIARVPGTFTRCCRRFLKMVTPTTPEKQQNRAQHDGRAVSRGWLPTPS